MKKVIRIGMLTPSWTKGGYNIFCRIEFNDPRLSISGVEGPLPSGNACGGCGQIRDDIRRNLKDLVPAPGWDKKKIVKFLDIWDKWHLNDMRPGCEHQTGPEWKYHDIEIKKYSLRWENYYALENAINAATANRYNLKTRGGLQIASNECYEAEILLYFFDLGIGYFSNIGLPDGTIEEARESYPVLDEYLTNHPEALQIKTEKKGNGWTYENEHPEGILMKACPVCGYKYGSAWRTEAIPQDVIDFLFSLPNTDITPAWV